MTSRTTEHKRAACLTVDLGAVSENWRRFAALAGPNNAAAVVKADAYGCGAARVGGALLSAGARTFFVATAGEGAALRSALGAGPTIYVLNGPEIEDAPLYAAQSLTPVLNTLEQISLWRSWSLGGEAALHVDTGMNRLGVAMAQLQQALDLTGRRLGLVISHLACASEPAHPMNAVQAGRFAAVLARAGTAKASLSATAGAFIGGVFAEGMLRPGIGLYGDNGFDEGGPNLACVARLEAPVLQIRDVEPGESVGYGATAVLNRPTRLAVIALGYADGYLRAAGGRGYGVVENIRCPVVGRISMDLITLDVSAAPAARVGAHVEMLGPAVPLKDVAAAASTSPYEVLTSLGRVERRYAGVSV